MECLETLTRGSYCSATQQNKPFQLPISYLVVAMIVPLGFKNLHKLPLSHGVLFADCRMQGRFVISAGQGVRSICRPAIIIFH